MSSFRYKITSAISIMILFMLNLYIAGGFVFAYDYERLTHIRFLCAMICICALLTLIEAYLIHTRTELSQYIRNYLSHTSAAERRTEFISYYNIDRCSIIILVFILIFGFILRLIGYNWGVVASWQPDEMKLVQSSVGMAASLSPYSENIYYPNQFTSKIAAVIIFIYARVTDSVIERHSSVYAFFIFRLISVTLGTLTIYTTYLIGNCLKKHLGLIFALLTAIYPHYIILAKQVTGDVTSLFFLSVTILYSVRYIKSRSDKYLYLMTLGAALASLEKWHGAIGIGYIGFILLFNCDSIKAYIVNGFKAVISYLIWFFIVAPNVIANPVKSIVDGFINIAVYDESEGPGYMRLFTDYMGDGVLHIAGAIFIILMICGITSIIRKPDRSYIFISLGILKILVLCFLNRAFPRWGLELYFCELFIVSVGIYHIYGLKDKISKSITIILASLISMEMLTGSILTSVAAVSYSLDTRLMQRADCKRMGITPDMITSQYYTGFSPSARCDSEYAYEDLNIKIITDWDEYIYESNDQLYRTNIQPDYICLTVSRYDIDRKLADTLDRYGCDKVLEYKAVCRDVFEIPILSTPLSLNDISVIKGNIDLIRSISAGGSVGDDMIIYDVSNLSFKQPD